jgi:DNA-binding transcriptional regulator YhcF (GntR family)
MEKDNCYCFDNYRIGRCHMKAEQSIAIMKALADRSRIAIANSLLEQPQYVEEIARRHALAPSTVSFHLRKLERAGLVTSRKEQYYTVFRANDEMFSATLRDIVSSPTAGKELQDERMGEYRRKVVESFFRDGRLEKLPAQHKKRLIVLDRFAARFEPGRRYTEQEVTGLITPLFDDYCTVRRLLVDEGVICRDGAAYWRAGEDGPAAAGQERPSEVPGAVRETKERKTGINRSEIKRLYKQNAPDMGVYQIRNSANGKIYVAGSRNLEGSRSSRMFQLRMGKSVFSRELQKDLSEFGADSFEFSVLAVLERPKPGESIDQALAALVLQWLNKLQPFGERGYNHPKESQRSAKL